jgi:hypothetical protein
MVLFDISSFWGISTKVSELSRHLPTTCPQSLQTRKHVFGNKTKKAVDDRQKEQLKILKRLQRIAEPLNKSIRRLTQETTLSSGTVQLIFKKRCMQTVHEIKPLDKRAPTT